MLFWPWYGWITRDCIVRGICYMSTFFPALIRFIWILLILFKPNIIWIIHWLCEFPQILPMNIKGPAGSITSVVNYASCWIISFSFNFIFEWSSTGDLTLTFVIHYCLWFQWEFILEYNDFWDFFIFSFLLCSQVRFSYLRAFLVLVSFSFGRLYQRPKGELWKK